MKGNQFALKHGHSKVGKVSKIFWIWLSMRNRCNNPKHKYYKNYGGRNIKICSRWNNFINFLVDMGECPNGLILDRIDNDGNYEPSNCRWTDYKTSNRNRRMTKLSMEKAKEIRKLYSWGFKQYEIAKHFNISPATISYVVNEKKWD